MHAQIQWLYEPISEMTFKGLHWIEASAGSGKTYTLSSLMVRIFLKDYLPNQVIATTFTRAAAAELKGRIRARLIETRNYFDACSDLSKQEIDEKIHAEKDPLFKKVLTDYKDKTQYAYSRLQLVIEQLDELFVGTLDSFSQKLLREFSFESGKTEHVNITDKAEDYTEKLIHDVLREWIQSQPQSMIDTLFLNGKLKAPQYYIDLVRTSLNFAAIEIHPVDAENLDTQHLENALVEIVQIQAEELETLQPYIAGEYTSNFMANVAGKEGGKLSYLFQESLPILIDSLKEQPLDHYYHPNMERHFSRIREFFLDSKGLFRSKIFKKATKACTEAEQEAFLNHHVIVILRRLVEAEQSFAKQLEQVEHFLKYHLSREVKKRLPQLLQQKGETTFAQQIRTLAESLQGEQGLRFAQYVHARYPLILVDEFQDTNQDQDDILARIWRHSSWYERGCMIMVGDPKQAIYGFRGGDMLTYNNARRDVLSKNGKMYSLAYNHRSVQELVKVVDELFQRDLDMGEQVYYQPVQAGSRMHPALVDHCSAEINPKPLRWLEIDPNDQAAIKVAWQILALLNQSKNGELYFANETAKIALSENDIAVLSTSHRSLDEVQFELERLGIRVNRANQRSIFKGFLAQDVAAILTAILHPFDEAKVKRALLTRLLGLNLKQLIELEKQGLGQFIYDFDCIREMWVNKGFLTAWNYCLNLFKVWENIVARQSFDNERNVVNLRHITELLSKQSERQQGIFALYHWYAKQLNGPGTRDWEKERKLSNSAGIQLMTVHQSKGLEFKIVFLLGADKAPKADSSPLVFSTSEIQSNGMPSEIRAISIKVADTPAQALDQHQNRLNAERNRLWYVALTRASHRVYAVMQTEAGKEKPHALNFWRLKPSQTQELADIAEQYSQSEKAPDDKPQSQGTEKRQYFELYAQSFPQQGFYPRTKTSFSALAQHLPAKKLTDNLVELDVSEALAADEDHTWLDTSIQVSEPISWIKEHFPRGTNAGSFLHKLFEHIRFDDERTKILEEVKRRFKNDSEFQSALLLKKLVEQIVPQILDEELAKHYVYEQVTDWLMSILSTPLHENFCLKDLKEGMHLAEFDFYLALENRRLATEKMKTMFTHVNKPIHDLNPANTARYLNGSIDLVYFDGQRYHIADYKSNYLGGDQSHYDEAHVHENMSHSSYWLQAAVYLVALHRYLKNVLHDYDISQHLGAATYLYLRGMTGHKNQGYYVWKPDDVFILELDQLFGYFCE